MTTLQRLCASILLPALALLVACSGGENPPGASRTASAPAKATAGSIAPPFEVSAVTVDTSSPDFALKTWWRLLDAYEEGSFAHCRRLMELKARLAAQIAAPELHAYFNNEPVRVCRRVSYQRDIESINQESDTRAVIRARIRNTTPIPEGMALSEMNSKARDTGTPYRYVFEKHEAQWRLAEVYSTDPLMAQLAGKGEERQYASRTRVADWTTYNQ